MDRPVTAPVHRQILRVVWIPCGGFLIERHAETRLVTGMHVAVPEGVVGVEHFADRVAVSHVFLDPEVGDAEVDVQRGGQADRGKVGGTVGAAADAVQGRQRKDAAQMGDAAGVDTVVRM